MVWKKFNTRVKNAQIIKSNRKGEIMRIPNEELPVIAGEILEEINELTNKTFFVDISTLRQDDKYSEKLELTLCVVIPESGDCDEDVDIVTIFNSSLDFLQSLINFRDGIVAALSSEGIKA